MSSSSPNVRSLKAALARTEATLAASNSVYNTRSGAGVDVGVGGGGGGLHVSGVAPTSPAVARLLRQHGLAMSGEPLDPRGLPEYDSSGTTSVESNRQRQVRVSCRVLRLSLIHI